MTYCNWVKAEVNITDLPAHCNEHILEGVCNHCKPSPQLELGMSAKDLIRNLKGI